ncbi:MAG: hypothetical protein QQW96_14215 [Tychonema bourrellyi B0820]|uniref:hypothetical protein n=1 Tax=Tychonema bourrellyi TaxID=54313 RepID=UPI001C558EFA|nr:hypothetical protein [Tychonema bourrellyi]MDQ2098792.1 hypothetical protein [Tychonema bourrellyi B0820]
MSKNRLRGIDLNTVSLAIFLSIAIDLFGDGLMIGTSLTIAPHLGVVLASGRVVAHIPEGFITNAAFKSQNMPRTRRASQANCAGIYHRHFNRSDRGRNYS